MLVRNFLCCVLLLGCGRSGFQTTDAADTDVVNPDAMLSCATSTGLLCNSKRIVNCENGVETLVESCPLDCVGGSSPQCRTFVPSNLSTTPTFFDVQGTPAPVFDAGDGVLIVGDLPEGLFWRLDSDTGRITAYSRSDATNQVKVVRAAGIGVIDGIGFTSLVQPESSPPDATTTPPRVGVFYLQSLHVKLGYTLYGQGAQPIMIIAGDEIVVDGTIDFGGGAFHYSIPGPGGGGFGMGEGVGQTGTNDSAVGGGSFGSLGGTGTGGPEPGGPGVLYGNSQLVPLRGGSAGGVGEGLLQSGVGGGGLQLTAQHQVVVTGTINVGGGGSGSSGSGDKPASGGGSGGALLLESRTIVFQSTSALSSNGGSGGRATGGTNILAHGTARSAPAQVSGNGGNGSDRTGQAGDGIDLGGGGGGAGRIRINTATGNEDLAIYILPSAPSLVTQGIASGSIPDNAFLTRVCAGLREHLLADGLLAETGVVYGCEYSMVNFPENVRRTNPESALKYRSCGIATKGR